MYYNNLTACVCQAAHGEIEMGILQEHFFQRSLKIFYALVSQG